MRITTSFATAVIALLGTLLVFAAPVTGAPLVYVNNLTDTVYVIDAATNAVARTIATGSAVSGLVLHPNGAQLYVKTAAGIKVLDTTTHAILATIAVNTDGQMALNAAGSRLYVASFSTDTVAVVDTATNTVIATIPSPRATTLTVNPAGTRVYVTDQSSEVYVIDATTNTPLTSVTVGNFVIGLAVDPSGSFLYAANANSGTISVVNTSTNSVVATVPVGCTPTDVAVHPAGTFVYTMTCDMTLRIIRTSDNALVASTPTAPLSPGADPTTTLEIHPYGTTLYVSKYSGGTVTAISTATNTVVGTVALGGNPTSLATAGLTLDGELDATFGTGGKTTTSFPPNTDNVAYGAAVRPDGKILAAGYAWSGDRDVALARYNANGTLDSSFGDGGKVVVDLTGVTGHDDARSIALQPDGKIVVGGSVDGTFAVARFLADGPLDVTFGVGGKTVSSFTGPDPDGGTVSKLFVLSNGKILAVGSVLDAECRCSYRFALARYNSDGTLDATFGTDGKVAMHFSDDSFDEAHGAALQLDGKIVVAGSTTPPGGPRKFAAVRYNPDGALDATFGIGGKVAAALGSSGDDAARAVALQADGKIVLAGYAYDAQGPAFALARYDPSGSFDSTFGVGGVVKTALPNRGSFDGAYAVVVQSDGRVVVGGVATRTGPYHDFAILRYEPTGAIDTTFGIAGLVRTSFKPSDADDGISSIVVQPDGNIIAVGHSLRDGSGYDFALARYVGTPPAQTSIGNDVTVSPSAILPDGSSGAVTVQFDQVTTEGSTTVTTSSTGTPPPTSFKLGTPPVYYDLTTTATFSGEVTVCFTWAEGQFFSERNLRLFHNEGGGWTDITTSVDTTANVACGVVTSLSPFAMFAREYDFTGFFQPVDNVPVFNEMKAGAAVPVRFSLGGNEGLSVFAHGYPKSADVTCAATAPVDGVEETATAGSTSLRYDAASDRYTYVWKTDRAWAGKCRQLVIQFADGTTRRANFKFVK